MGVFLHLNPLFENTNACDLPSLSSKITSENQENSPAIRKHNYLHLKQDSCNLQVNYMWASGCPTYETACVYDCTIC